MNKHYCPKCQEEQQFKFYDGCLGYESVVCCSCGFDVNEITIIDLDNLFNRFIREKLKGGLK